MEDSSEIENLEAQEDRKDPLDILYLEKGEGEGGNATSLRIWYEDRKDQLGILYLKKGDGE